ncbi:hypothetical protein AX16_007276, partial [Volvariella volvacea WC 439]
MSEQSCCTKGLSDLGFFGSEIGHCDTSDFSGAIPTTIVNTDLLSLYEEGLIKHGKSPLIAPPHKDVLEHVYRLIVVCYPFFAALNTAGAKVVPFATLPNKQLLTMAPEITNLL